MTSKLVELLIKLGLTIGVTFTNGVAQFEVCNSYGGGFEEGQRNVYLVTEINETKVHGDDLAYDGTGVFVYKEEINEPVEIGDTIAVVWGEEEDELVSVKKIYGCEALVKK